MNLVLILIPLMVLLPHLSVINGYGEEEEVEAKDLVKRDPEVVQGVKPPGPVAVAEEKAAVVGAGGEEKAAEENNRKIAGENEAIVEAAAEGEKKEDNHVVKV